MFIALLMMSSSVEPLAQIERACGPYWYGQPSAVVWKDQLFAAIKTPCRLPSEVWYDPPLGYVYRETFFPDRRPVRRPTVYWNPISGREYLAKMEVRGDSLLLSGAGAPHYILPLAEMPLMSTDAFAEHLCALRGYGTQNGFFQRFHIIGRSGGSRLLFPDHRKPDVAVPPPRIPYGGDLRPDNEVLYTQVARYDVLIAGPQTVCLFHAHEGKLFVSVELNYLVDWYYDRKGGEAKNRPTPPDRELRTGKLPADFTGDFVAYRGSGRDFLVTPSGKVYAVAPRGKDAVDVTAIWNDPKRPIVGVVQDLANDAVYGWGFATDNKSVERSYVKFEANPVAVPYKLTVPLWSNRSDAYLESYECARAFRRAAEKK